MVDIGSQRVQPRARVRRNTRLVAPRQIQIVLRRRRAAAETAGHFIGWSGIVVELALVIVCRRNLSARIQCVEQTVGSEAVSVRQVQYIGRGLELPCPEQPIRDAPPNAACEIELGSRARRPPLGTDDDNAVGGARPVHRRCRRRLQYFNRFDLIGVQVRQSIDERVLIAPNTG